MTNEETIDVVRVAFDTVIEALVDIQSQYNVGFTCSEAEALYEAMVAVGAAHTAETFMVWHSTLDDVNEGDMHRPVYSTEYPDLPVAFERLDLDELDSIEEEVRLREQAWLDLARGVNRATFSDNDPAIDTESDREREL